MALAKRKPSRRIAKLLASKRDEPCASQHFGAWFINPKWMQDATNAVRMGTLQPNALSIASDSDEEPEWIPYTIHNGVAVIEISGQITKRPSSFGGASTIKTRRAVRMAAEDSMVRSILLVVDSPGGTIAGVADLANDIDHIDAEVKPVYAYCQDLACSAGYWIASQARHVFANETALVGCIGAYGVLMDTSKSDEMMGFDYVLVSTGGVKGLGADGKVTDELVADYKRELFDLQDRFNAAVMRRRGFNETQMTALADGRAHVGEKAVELGLVDTVASLDDALNSIFMELHAMDIATLNAGKPSDAAAWVSKELAAAHDHISAESYAKGKADARADVEKAVKAKHDAELVAAIDKANNDTMARFKALSDKYGEKDAAFVAEQFAAGHDLGKAAEAWADRCEKREAEARKALKDANDKLIDKESGSDAGAGHAAPVAAAPAADNDPATIADPEARAKAEWAAMTDDEQKKYHGEAVYVAARRRELRAAK